MAILATQDQTRQQWYLQVKPACVSKENEQRALVLCKTRQNKMKPKEPPRETLWDLAAKYDKGVGRQWKSQNVLHNREFLIALVLDGEGRSDAVRPIDEMTELTFVQDLLSIHFSFGHWLRHDSSKVFGKPAKFQPENGTAVTLYICK